MHRSAAGALNSRGSLLADLCLAAVVAMVASAVMDSHGRLSLSTSLGCAHAGLGNKSRPLMMAGIRWVRKSYRAPLMPTVATAGAEPAERVLVYGRSRACFVIVIATLRAAQDRCVQRREVSGSSRWSVAFLGAPFVFTVLLASFRPRRWPRPARPRELLRSMVLIAVATRCQRR